MKVYGKIAMVAVAIMVVLSLTVQARRGEKLSETYDAKQLVRIETVSGDCTITKSTSGKIEVQVFASVRPSDAFEPIIKERANSLRLSERFYGSSSGSSEWVIAIPEGTEIRFESASGDLTIEEMDGEFEVSTASGDLRFEGCTGEFDFNTASGDIEMIDCTGDFNLNSASGDIETENCKGEFEVDVASGEIDVRGVILEHPSHFSSASGDVQVILGASPTEDLSVSTASGSVVLDYNGHPIEGYFEFTSRQRRGQIDSPIDFDDEETFRRHGERYVKKVFTRGKDAPEILLSTASGRISLEEG